MPRVMKEISNEHFRLLVKVRGQLAPIVDEFGNPCKDYCKGCASCDAWKRVINFIAGTPSSLTWGDEDGSHDRT